MVEFCGQEVLIEKSFSTRGMSLDVNSTGRVTVKVGYCLSFTEKEIQEFVNKHKRYLRNRIASFSSVRLPDFSNGGNVFLLGKDYTVERNDYIKSISIDGDTLKIPNNFYSWESERFFGNLLFPYVRAMTELYAEVYGLTCSYVGLHTWESAWGTHFGEDNSIKYNIALVFVPEECIEYVVAHELCHSLYHNHSAAFWSEVERIYPHYKEDRKRLNNYNIEWLFKRAKLGKRS